MRLKNNLKGEDKMKGKKLGLFILISSIITSSFVTGCTSKNESKNNSDKLITLVLDKGGVNDESFNQLAWKGAQDAKEEYGVTVKYLESNSDADYKTNIETAIDMESDLIIGVGFNLTDPIKNAAESYKEQKFAIVDGSFETIPSNVTPILFDEKEAGYLAGLVVGKTVDSDKFGFIGGLQVPAVLNYRDGFEQGLKEVNNKAVLVEQFANSFTDAAKGKAIASQMYSDNVECIMTAGGGVNLGVYESGKEVGKYAVAVDMSQSHISPTVIITSALKKVDNGIKETIGHLVNDDLTGGKALVYNILNDGVGYEKTDLISKDTEKYVNDQIKKLKEQK